MTWDEFKSIVDKKIAEMGKDGSAEIWYIDISMDKDESSLQVLVENSGLSIH